MIVSWNQLQDYVRLDAPVADVEHRLMMAGLNHESTEEVDGDFAIDLEVTSNRPDCLGCLGVAREAAVLFDRELTPPPTDFVENGPPIGELTSVEVRPEAVGWCLQYRARVLENIKIGPSPDWMQRRLRTVGLRPINNVVDVTNYVLLECGQPLHAFDLDKLIEQRIVVRNATPDEKFAALDDKTYTLAPTMGVIADACRAAALAGVMGGSETAVGSSTTRILLEIAEFAPLSIRRASRALDLSSDSSYRFERKIDPEGLAWAGDRACHLLQKLAGATVARGVLHVGAPPDRRPPVVLRFARLEKILGVPIGADEAVRTLQRLGLELVERSTESAAFRAPSFRRDLTREIDLVEEVGRIHGYDDVPENRRIPVTVAAEPKTDRVVGRLRDTLVGLGCLETVTFSFDLESVATAVRPWTTAVPLQHRHNDFRAHSVLRQSLLPSLAAAYGRNEAHGNLDVALFELANVYLPRPGAALPD
ncbi:MAG: phenylalanine--tRNA ligase subunit beta, partial [Planctomycetia bacterium]